MYPLDNIPGPHRPRDPAAELLQEEELQAKHAKLQKAAIGRARTVANNAKKAKEAKEKEEEKERKAAAKKAAKEEKERQAAEKKLPKRRKRGLRLPPRQREKERRQQRLLQLGRDKVVSMPLIVFVVLLPCVVHGFKQRSGDLSRDVSIGRDLGRRE